MQDHPAGDHARDTKQPEIPASLPEIFPALALSRQVAEKTRPRRLKNRSCGDEHHSQGDERPIVHPSHDAQRDNDRQGD